MKSSPTLRSHLILKNADKFRINAIKDSLLDFSNRRLRELKALPANSKSQFSLTESLDGAEVFKFVKFTVNEVKSQNPYLAQDSEAFELSFIPFYRSSTITGFSILMPRFDPSELGLNDKFSKIVKRYVQRINRYLETENLPFKLVTEDNYVLSEERGGLVPVGSVSIVPRPEGVVSNLYKLVWEFSGVCRTLANLFRMGVKTDVQHRYDSPVTGVSGS